MSEEKKEKEEWKHSKHIDVRMTNSKNKPSRNKRD